MQQTQTAKDTAISPLKPENALAAYLSEQAQSEQIIFSEKQDKLTSSILTPALRAEILKLVSAIRADVDSQIIASFSADDYQKNLCLDCNLPLNIQWASAQR